MKLAMKLHQALQGARWLPFFRQLLAASYLPACLGNMYSPGLRCTALQALLKGQGVASNLVAVINVSMKPFVYVLLGLGCCWTAHGLQRLTVSGGWSQVLVLAGSYYLPACLGNMHSPGLHCTALQALLKGQVAALGSCVIQMSADVSRCLQMSAGASWGMGYG